MLPITRWSFGFVFFGLIAPILGATAPARAEEKPAEPAKAAAEKDAKADPFVVPDGTPEELLAYMEKLQNERPEPGGGPEATKQFVTKLAKSLWEAADKVLSADKATQEQKATAAKAKLGAISFLSNFGDEKTSVAAATAMNAIPEELTKLGLADLARAAQAQILSVELRKSLLKLPGAPPLDTVLGKVVRLVAEKPDRGNFQLAYATISALQMIEENEKAADLCDDFAKAYSESKSPGIDTLAEKFEAIGRRLRLVGHPMKVEGVLMDGKPLDWDTYKGKVVLVQFWATWCGYCVKEIPNIEKCYDEYRDRGFDVVSISLDRSQADLDAFLKNHKLPWPVLYKEGQRNATADYYGVTGLPTLILVGKDGNVVSLNARGENLNKELENLLGPAKAEAKEPAGS